MAPPPSPPAPRAPIPDAPFHDHPTRPSLEGERHNSSDDSVATLASTASSASYTSMSTLHSDLGAAELLNEPLRRGSCEAGTATPLEQRMEGLGLRERGSHEPHAVPPFLRPSASPPPSSARPLLPSIVTSSSAYAGMHASSSIAHSSSLSSSPGVSPSVAVFPPSSSTSAATSVAAPAVARPHRTSSPFGSPFSSPRTSALSSSTPSLRPNFGGAASVMGGSASSSRAGSMPPSGAAYAGASTTRPSSADTTSTSSSGRPWVFDSDASSICSASSSSCGTSGATTTSDGASAGGRIFVNEEGHEQLVDEGGEVYKPQGDYFLDERPEPPNTSLDIDRSDPAQVVVRVRLPGFSLDNITVAMRRGHKVHVVADSYGESGGHYEKLVTLGSDVSSAAPRAEFDGTLLRIFIHRRPSRPSSAVSVPGQVASSPFGYGFGSSGSPFAASLSSSPDPSGSRDHSRRASIASSLASARSSIDSYGSLPGSLALSPSLESYAFGPPLIPLPLPGGEADAAGLDDEALPPPCTARAGPPPDYHKRARCLTGPEGARAAAKAAREEAARRAKEEVKNLPKEARGGRRLPFRRQKEEEARSPTMATGSASSGGEGASSSSSSGWGTSGSSSPITSDSASLGSTLASVERNGTIKASSRTSSPLPLPPHDALKRPPLSHQSSGSSTVKGVDAVTSHALDSAAFQLTEHLERHPSSSSLSSGHEASSSAARPKLRGHNLTLRPFDRAQSFVDAAAAAAVAAGEATGASSPSASSDGGGATPRREERGMRFFTPFST
ncbi:hypothetical protein JCM8208_000441 [Rhodotorula glutinis]